MAYLAQDVSYFVAGAPYLALSRVKSASKFLERHLSLRDECFTGLHVYPELQVAPLSFFYLTARSLGMLDPQSLHTMLTTNNWRGVVWGGWLALLKPNVAFAEPLAQAHSPEPENLWTSQCALALLEGRSPPPHLAHVNAIAARVREAMANMPIPRMPLRPAPTPDQHHLLDAERLLVHAAYKAHGVERARAVLQGTLLRELSTPYRQWYAEQRRAR